MPNQGIQTAKSLLGFDDDYESEQLEYFSDLLQRSHCSRFIDVGANKGLYAHVANSHMRGGHIALIEADPRLAQDLKTSVSTWPSHDNKIDVFAVAAADKPGTMPFQPGQLDTLGTLVAKSDSPPNDTIMVQCVALDALFQTSERTLIKCDVEGFEYRVMLGAKNVLKNGVAIVEFHGWGDAAYGKYPFHVCLLMIQLGFAARRIGKSYAYEFVKAGNMARLASAAKYLPVLGAKYLIRVSKLRDPIYKLLKIAGLRSDP